MQPELIGRDAEVAALEAWLTDPWGRLVLVEGDAGIGKTTVWRHACAHSSRQGHTVASCSPSEAERHLVFAGLADLLGPLLAEAAGALAPARRRAIEAALLLDDGHPPPPEERAVAFATLDVLRHAARQGSLVLAIDDAQWLDRSSALVVAFALRRLGRDDRIAVLAARRSDVDDDLSRLLVEAIEPELRTTVAIGPLSLGAVHRLFRERLELSLPRPRLVRVHEICGGNPLFALEIGRAMADPAAAHGELPIPPNLADALAARLSPLSPAARHVALLAAAAAEPTLTMLVAAFHEGGAQDAISEVAVAGILLTDDDAIRFDHPLLASAAYAHGSDEDRRNAHAALAEVAAAPEERARHLALAQAGPNAGAASALDEAAVAAAARGAQAASGELGEWAAEMTPEADPDARAARLLSAGYATFLSGDTERARTLLERVASVPGPRQHEAEWRLGTVLDETTGGGAAREHWLRALATDDLELRVHVERSIAVTALYVESVETALSHSASAVEAAERLGDTRVLAYALATDALVRTLGGDPLARDVLARAVELEPDADLPELEWSPGVVAAECARVTLSLEEAREGFARIYELAVARGDIRVEIWSAYGKGQVAIDAGAWTLAAELCATVDDLVQQSTLMALPALRLGARLAGHRGDADRCRALAGRCLAEARADGERLHELQALAVIGALELSEGDSEVAANTLDEAHAVASVLGIGAPGMLRYEIDRAEALARLGRLDEADAVLGAFEAQAGAVACPWARPLVDRGRGLTTAARGNLEGAVGLLRTAESARDLVPLPLERARIDLCLGRALRRLKRRSEASDALDRAIAAFESLGSRLWAEQARAERARIGGHTRSDGLTPTEAQVAALVAEGKTNKETAALLFVTTSTVEAHLSRVYAKLGIRSRSQLSRALAEQGPGVSSLSDAAGPA